MAIRRFTVQKSSIIDPGSVCSNPTITYVNPQGLTVPCDNGSSLDIEINTDVASPYCLDFIISCADSCSACGDIVVTKCFCIDGGDCENCSNCDNYQCVSRCDGKYCDQDTCVDCDDAHPCIQNQICSQGDCVCEAGLKKRADGKCVQCFDEDDLGPCLKCFDGNISATDCPNGVCNPNTGGCQECYNNEQCASAGPNKCCGPTGNCECCPGYMLDPATNQCVVIPPCTNAQQCIDLFGPCYYCTVNGCAPKPCPSGFVCDPNTGECVPGCVNGVCPEGSGCLNGRCVPCSTLSCTGSGQLCEFAAGCECIGNSCEYINCHPDTVELEWKVTHSTPGTPIPGTGLASLQGTTNIVALGMVYNQAPNSSGYYNHQFNLAITNGTSGSWTREDVPGQSVIIGSGTSVSFTLESTGPNLVGFVVRFTETGTGRTATWGIYRTPTAPLDQPNVWNYEFTSTGVASSTSGGQPGSIQLCSNNGNFIPTSVTNVVTTGDLVVTFFPVNGSNCLTVTRTGCGTWDGDVVLSCGGQTITVPAPTLIIDPANCCDPTDFNCGGWGTADPCSGLTIQNIDLVALPTYGQNIDGDGEFLVVADWTSAGLSFIDLFYLNPAPGCWSTANNPASSSNDIAIVTGAGQSPLGPSASALAVVVTLGEGGCVRLGHTCELKISGCKKLQGEICLTKCSAFSVNIIDLGSNSYTAVPSIADGPVTYLWVVQGGGTITNPTGQSITLSPAGGSTTLIVTARLSTCVATDQISLSTTIPGCTDITACNYNPLANQNDNTCLTIGNPSYECLTGLVLGTASGIPPMPSIQWKIGSITYADNNKLDPGTYTMDVYVNNIQKCSRTLTVPQCYRCVSEVCVPAPDGYNQGEYTTNNCDNSCACDIEVTASHARCVDGRASILVNATGDTGAYSLTVTNAVTGERVVSAVGFTTATGYSTIEVCPGLYTVLVTGNNCSDSATIQVSCTPCVGSTLALTNISHDCETRFLDFTIVGSPCSTSFNVSLLDSDLVALVPPVGPILYTSAGVKHLYTGALTPGAYAVRLTDNTGCTIDYPIVVCPDSMPSCTITSGNLTHADNGTTLTFTANFNVNSGTGIYQIRLFEIGGGSCPGSWVPTGSPIAPPAFITTPVPTPGSNTVVFEDISIPVVTTCYAVEVQRTDAGYESCSAVYLDQFLYPTGPDPVCSGTISNLAYLANDNDEFSVSWAFSNASNNLTLEAYLDAGACPTIGPLAFTQTGLGNNGTGIAFGPIEQIQGVSQCLYVKIFDAEDPTCYAEAYETVPACNCEIVIDNASMFVDTDNERLEFDFTTKCTSGNINLDFSPNAPAIVTGSATLATGSTDGTVVTHSVLLNLADYPTSGGSGLLEITDDADGSCIDTLTVILPQNCVACSQIATFGDGGAVVTDIIDAASNTIATGSYDLSVAGDRDDLEADTEAGAVAQGGNFCSGGTHVGVARNPAYAGITVNQDNEQNVALNYANVTNASWVGTRKTYFGDCGCEIGTICDYTATMDLTAFAGATGTMNFSFYYGDSGVTQYTKLVSVNLGMLAAIDSTDENTFATAVQNALEAANCGYTVGVVTAAWDLGTMTMVLTIPGTNAAIGVVAVGEEDGLISNETFEFNQAGCV